MIRTKHEVLGVLIVLHGVPIAVFTSFVENDHVHHLRNPESCADEPVGVAYSFEGDKLLLARLNVDHLVRDLDTWQFLLVSLRKGSALR